MAAITFDPGAKSPRITLSNGNLTAVTDGTINVENVKSTAFASAGKLYAEFTVTTSGGGSDRIGIADVTADLTATQFGTDTHGYTYLANGLKANGGNSAYGATYTTGDVISVVLDLDAGNLTFWKNGVSQGLAFSGITGSWTPGLSENSSTICSVTANYGNTAFAFTPPTGYIGWAALVTGGGGNVTLEKLTAAGSRIAAGAVTMQPITAVGGFRGFGAAVMQGLQVAGAGGTKGGSITLQSPTALGTGFESAYSLSTIAPLTATGTGFESGINTVADILPSYSLSATGITGGVGNFQGVIPSLLLQITVNAVAQLTLPAFVPNLNGLSGNVGTLATPLPFFTEAGTEATGNLGNANIVFAPFVLLTSGVDQGLGKAPLTLRPYFLTATGASGGVGIAIEVLKLFTLGTTGYGSYTGDAALTPNRLFLNASGYTVLALGNRTWVLNLRKKGLTEYNNFNFNSYATVGDTILAAGPNGLFVLDNSASDNTTQIAATVRTGADTFGTSYNKRVPRIYASYSTNGAMNFITITSQGGRRTYLLPYNNLPAIQERRVPVNRGPKSPYWQFEMSNVQGADFAIENLQVHPEKSRRRVV